MLHPALIHRPDTHFKKKDPFDLRLGDRIQDLHEADQLKAGDVVILGVCNEVGVLANGGRPGAAEGPLFFRKAFTRLTDACLGDRGLWDAGDVPSSVDYPVFFEAAEAVVAAVLARGAVPVVVGGGHDCAYGDYLGLRKVSDRPAAINIDAHLDMRPVEGPSSGNPFHRMLRNGLPGDCLAAAGLQVQRNALAHVAAAREQGVHLQFLEPGRESEVLAAVSAALARFQDRTVLASFDMDSVGAAWASGVSALNPWGLSSDTAIQLARLFGQCPSVAVFDLMEFSPAYDKDGRTGWLVAFLAAEFIQGLAFRPAGTSRPRRRARR
jgi:formimidoylglutamase